MTFPLQARAADWSNLHYPGESTQQKLQNVAEEFGELVVELEGDVEAIIRTLRASVDRPRTGTRAALEGEAGDLQLAVFDLASTINVDSIECLESKMAQLSQRTPSESQARAARKVSLGIPSNG